MRRRDLPRRGNNAALRKLRKTVMFGMQDRLLNGVLIEGDTILPRFPAGLPLPNSSQKITRYLIRTILKKGISVMLVGGKGLLIVDNVTTFGF
jgi:hypothetical protein